MKKQGILRIICLIAISSYIILLLPKSIGMSGDAVLYQLGEGNEHNIYETTLSINGKVKRDLKLNKWFKGYISLHKVAGIEQFLSQKYSKELYDKLLTQKVTIRLDRNNGGSLEYWMPVKGEYIHERIGEVYFNKDFTQITIAVSTPGYKPGSKHWGSEEGWMLSFPAATRSNGLQISNELLKKYYRGNINDLK